MSIDRITDNAIQRRTSKPASISGPQIQTREGIIGFAPAGAGAPKEQPPAGKITNQGAEALKALVAFVPTEIITLYIAAQSALLPQLDKAPQTTPPSEVASNAATALSQPLSNLASAASSALPHVAAGEWIAFFALLAATPLVVWLVYAAKVKSQGSPIPFQPKKWPIFEILASTIAFAVWVYAVPGTPFRGCPHYSGAIAGLLVLSVSILFKLVEPLLPAPTLLAPGQSE